MKKQTTTVAAEKPSLAKLAAIFSPDNGFQPFWAKTIADQKVNFYTLAETFGYTAEEVKAVRTKRGFVTIHLPERGVKAAPKTVDAAKLAAFVARASR